MQFKLSDLTEQKIPKMAWEITDENIEWFRNVIQRLGIILQDIKRSRDVFKWLKKERKDKFLLRVEEAVEEESALSERAIQQLLDTLEQKLEKGSISHPLYNRLRNKYLTRLKKFKDRRVAATQQE